MKNTASAGAYQAKVKKTFNKASEATALKPSTHQAHLTTPRKSRSIPTV
jgi:hypothetical protein